MDSLFGKVYFPISKANNPGFSVYFFGEIRKYLFFIDL